MPKAKILIVEDDLIAAKDIEGRLQSFGYEVTAIVSSGSGALSQIKKNPPDLVLMDIKLRDEMDGIETADLIRIRFDIPVVYVTAYADFETLVRAKKTESFGFIAKPFDSGELNGMVEMALNKHGIEKKLRESEARLLTTLRSIGDEVIVTDTSGKITFMNPVAEELTGWNEEESKGKPLEQVFKIINEDKGKPVENPVERVLKEGKVVGLANHTVLITKDGKQIPIDGSGSPINDDKGNIIGVVLTFKDITERKQTEEALRASEERFRGVAERSSDIILLIDKKGRVTSPSITRILGYYPDNPIGKTDSMFMTKDDYSKLLKYLPQVLKGEILENIEIPLQKKDGSQAIVEWTGSPIYNAYDVVGLQLLGRDITERKKAEEQIQKDLKEKEVLLKEIHHRVKNNLQVISSLLNLQAGHIKDKQALDMFEESKNRVRSMGLIHEELYRSGDFSKVDFTGYIKNLSSSLFRAYSTAPDRIKLRTNIDDVSLEIDSAIPCGLIINELVSNALKHAFPPSFEGKGKIEITLGSMEAGEIELIVKDNGVGIPKELDIRKTESLGMQLVFILAEDQLEGEVKLDRREGTKFTIRFKQEQL